jgi:stage V sporulation protein R
VSDKLLWTDAEWTYERIQRTWNAIEKINDEEFGIDIYRNQFEIITADQMISAYSTIGLPVYYDHWSFGKRFTAEYQGYKAGRTGLALEMVINSNPTINYLMEENTMTAQALVMAHAGCVSGDTEYFSEAGWKPIAEYAGGKVLQYNENGSAELVTPSRYIKRPSSGSYINVKSASFDQLITDDHTVVFQNGNGNLVKISGEELSSRRSPGLNGKILTAFRFVGGKGLPLTDDEIRLHIATPSYEGKRFTQDWLEASADQFSLISQEIGNYKFSSEHLSDVEYVQFVWAACGYHTHISEGIRCWEVQRSSRSGRSLSQSQPFERVSNVDGFDYCFTVPSGMLVLRRNKMIFVTGNCGHNGFFKSNYLFKTWTDADSIVDYMIFAKDYVATCEQREGREAVELFLDSCHALMNHGVNRYKRPSKISLQKEKERQREREAYLQSRVDELYRILPQDKPQKKPDELPFPESPEENILYFCEKHSPFLKPWQRELIRIVRKVAQYFYPQAQTKVANEGFASWTHYKFMNRLHDKGLIDDGAQLEWLMLHSSVLYQPAFDHPHYSGINPYKLGFEILRDIERICANPTDEDRRWFPDLMGANALDVIKDIVANYRDESMIRQFLSPKVMRDFSFFKVHDDREEDYYEVSAIHNEDGFASVREALAETHEREIYVPKIEVYRVDYDRSLWLRWTPYKNRVIADPDPMMKHILRLWGDPGVETAIHLFEGDWSSKSPIAEI